jgi:hypothetical protein
MSQPYVAEHSHNMFAKLGARIAFLGIDARTEVCLSGIMYSPWTPSNRE